MDAPAEKQLTMQAYKLLPEGTRAELIDNHIFEPPSPSFGHQDILLEIAIQLRLKFRGKAKVVPAPFDVYLDEVSNAVQPDIVVIFDSNKGTLNRAGHFHGTPDIVVEVLSAGSKHYDLIKKRALYQKFAVTEYWIIDTENRIGMVYSLKDARLVLEWHAADSIRSALLNETFCF